MRPRQLWGRRSVAVGIVLVGVALIGGLILLIAGGDNGSGNGRPATADLTTLQNRFLGHTVVVPEKGISLRRPRSWKVTKHGGVTNIQSSGGCVATQLSAPVPAGKADELRKDGIAVLRNRFKNAKVQPAGGSQIGGVPTTSSTITVKDANRDSVRVLLSVGTGTRNAYLTEVIVRNPSCQGDLQMAQLMLSSAEFTK